MVKLYLEKLVILKKIKNLINAGYITRKGIFGNVMKGSGIIILFQIIMNIYVLVLVIL